MNDTGAGLSADAGEIVAVMEQGVDEGAVFIASGGMNDEARRFVDDQDVGIFVEDFERDVLGDDLSRDGFWNGEGDGVASFESGTRFGGFAVESGVVGSNEVLDAGAREFRQLAM